MQREDKILFFITLKQLVILIIGFGISYTMFVSINKTYELNEFQQTLIWIPAAIACVFAFFKIKGMTMLQFLFLALEKIFRPARRYWVQNGGIPFVSMTTNVMLPKDKNAAKEETNIKMQQKNVKSQKIRNIADIVDQANDGKVTSL